MRRLPFRGRRAYPYAMTIRDVKPGQRVRLIQEIDRREGAWRAETVGVVDSVHLEKTGSWFAHAKDDQLWLCRVRLRKDDGELTTVTLDPYLEIELLSDAPAAP
jgi:hypothetical protein